MILKDPLPTLGAPGGSSRGLLGICRVPCARAKNPFLNGEAILDPMVMFGLFWAPSTHKSRSVKNFGAFRKLEFLGGSQLGAKMAPGPPTWSQDGPQTSNLEPGWPPDPPTWSQDGHQTFKSRSYFLLSPGTVAGLAVRQLDIWKHSTNNHKTKKLCAFVFPVCGTD